MKSNMIFLFYFFIIPIDLFCMERSNNELSAIDSRIQLLHDQNRKISEFIDRETKSLPEDTILPIDLQVQSLQLSLQRQQDNLQALQTALSDKTGSKSNNLPKSDLLQIDFLDVSQIHSDIARLLKHENVKNPIERAAIDWLYPYKSILPSKINPYHITKMCIAVPAIWSIAAVLSADKASMRKEVVMGACRVGFFGGLSAYLSSYSAGIWNPFRVKLDSGSESDCQLRVVSHIKNIDQMNHSLASYYEHVQARRAVQVVIAFSQAAAEKAEESKKASIITSTMVKDLSILADQRDKDARQRDEENLQRMTLLEEGQGKLLESVDVLYQELQNIHSDFKVTKKDLVSYFHDDQQARDRFESIIRLKLGSVQNIQMLQYLQGQRQLYIAEQTATQQGIVLKNIPSLHHTKVSFEAALPSSSSRLHFSQPQASKQMMKIATQSWNKSATIKKQNQFINIITTDQIGRPVNKISYDHTDVRNMAAILMQSAIRGKIVRHKMQIKKL